MAKIKKKPQTFKEWWDKNKERLNKERREKYHSDPEFRQLAKEKSRRNYRIVRRRDNPVDRYAIRDANGNRYWTIGRIARIINRPIPTIRSYHIAGVLPEPTVVDSRKWRLYTSAQAALLRQAFKALDDPTDSTMQALADITAFVTPRWEG
jgi:hypothetical protein